MKYIAALLLSFTLVSPALAQTNAKNEAIKNVQQKTKEVRTQAIEGIKDIREKAKDEIKGIKNDIKTEGRALIGSSTVFSAEQIQAFKERREVVQKEIKTRSEALKQTVEKQREATKKKIETLKTELEKKLRVVKDEQKRTIVGDIFEQLNEIKDRRVDNFSKAVDQLESVAGNILSRAEKASANGKDISSVTSAIEAAEKAVSETKSLIEKEAGKTYSVSVGSEATLRSDMTKAREELRSDLEKIQESVKTARDAVQKAAVTLAQIPNINQLEVASSTTPAGAAQ